LKKRFNQRHSKNRARDIGSGCQRTYLYQRSAIDSRNINSRTFSGSYSVCRQSVGIAKIKTEEERVRLKQLIQSIKPKGFGVIVRTVAEEKKVAELDNELKILVKRWEEAIAKVQQSKGVSLILEELGRTVGIIRDLFSPSFKHIHINDPAVYTEVRDYVELIAPERKDIVKLYKEEAPIYDNFGISKQLKSAFGKTVSLKSGAYLIIEHTEALHVIDVNSGNRSKAGNGQEANALDVNMAAADEIARQLRLRDMGGIIVVDFIDMHETEIARNCSIVCAI